MERLGKIYCVDKIQKGPTVKIDEKKGLSLFSERFQSAITGGGGGGILYTRTEYIRISRRTEDRIQVPFLDFLF